MVEVQLRYVTSRTNKSGKVLWYWQRKGFPLERLPDTERARVARALRLNEQADARRAAGGDADYGTFGWLIPLYRAGDAFTKRAQNTRDAYDSWLKRFEVDLKDVPVADADFRFVSDLINAVAAKGKTTKLPLAVLGNLFKLAKYERLISENPAEGVSVNAGAVRDQIWTDEQVESLCTAAAAFDFGPRFVLAVTLLLHTAQRPVDIRSMTWAHWKDGAILVRQQKTDAYLQLYCHTDLRAALTDAKKTANGLTIVTQMDGSPLTKKEFERWYGLVCIRAGITGLQARDFRRTAIVKLAEAGCTVPEIASVSGHTLAHVHHILKHYLPRTPKLARTAIRKLERSENKKSKRLD